ncbi:plasmid mobilization relaxosome protein MobC [Chitinophaga horti]|uniref:Plasmid mobilization relaxosome protein MobC n=1 Tax=Chitinophaga horti TaxID=2920382 RepID=A0ABY6IXS4_9BACT|nr:plasmid mobilization relaxosome protein MobC [Chitinophaga horti]UYQ92187.1 plasmid mobilization relaxosome protein MobC [Chitinophaga horti]
MKENVKRNQCLKIRLTSAESEVITKLWKASTQENRASYAREVLLQKPITVSYRNRSLDDTMAELIALRKELNNIGNNFNQAVHKLHMVDNIPQLKTWLQAYDQQRQIVAQKISEIRQYIDKLGDLWLQ